jgi:hypothetical protein
MRPLVLLLAGILCVALLAACGDDDDDGSDTTPTPSASAAGTSGGATSTGAAGSPTAIVTNTPGPTRTPVDIPDQIALPVTDVQAILSQTYKEPGGLTPTASELPVPPGRIRALWYQSDGSYVVYYAGLSSDLYGPLCPGNSLRTASGFLYTSNSPTHEGSCQGAINVAAAPAGLKLCASKLVYLTQIPADAVGTLYGSIEIYQGDGTVIGLTSLAETVDGPVPEVDLSTCTDAVS